MTLEREIIRHDIRGVREKKKTPAIGGWNIATDARAEEAIRIC
jgi:hypothetical protein